MVYTVVFSPESDEDLSSIYDGIALNGFPSNAASFTGAIREFCIDLRMFPSRGVRRDDLAPGVRILGYRHQALIAFDIEEEKQLVTILRIFGRGQSVERAFEQP